MIRNRYNYPKPPIRDIKGKETQTRKSFDFSILYTSFFHDKLKSKLKEIINQCFFHKNSDRRFQYVVIGYKDTYFVRDHSDAPQKNTQMQMS